MTNDKQMYKTQKHNRRVEDFAPMVNQYGPALMAFVGRIVTIQEDAEDVVQEAFVTAYEHLNDYAPEKASLKTWLYRIATNVALNVLGKQKVRAALSFESLADSQVKKIEDDPWFNGNELEIQLSKAIQKLPQKQKAVFCLRYYQELSYEEISEIMGSSVGALKASYHFAYEKIKKELKDNFTD